MIDEKHVPVLILSVVLLVALVGGLSAGWQGSSDMTGLLTVAQQRIANDNACRQSGGMVKPGKPCICLPPLERAGARCVPRTQRPAGACPQGAQLNRASNECVCVGVAGAVINRATNRCECPAGQVVQNAQCVQFATGRTAVRR